MGIVTSKSRQFFDRLTLKLRGKSALLLALALALAPLSQARTTPDGQCTDSLAATSPSTPEIQATASAIQEALEKKEFEQAKAVKDLIGKTDFQDYLESIRARAERNKFDISKLTDSELVAIAYYTSSGYQTLNGALRSGDPGKYRPLAEALNSGLDKLPDHPAPAYRGCSLSCDLKEIHQAGALIQYSGFTSTASEKDRAWGGTKFEIRGKHGKNVDPISSCSGEKEVLFKSGTYFRIIEFNEKENRIVMEEVEPTAGELASKTEDTKTYLEARKKNKTATTPAQPISIPTPVAEHELMSDEEFEMHKKKLLQKLIKKSMDANSECPTCEVTPGKSKSDTFPEPTAAGTAK